MKIGRSIKNLRITYTDRRVTQQASTSNVNLRADEFVKEIPAPVWTNCSSFLPQATSDRLNIVA